MGGLDIRGGAHSPHSEGVLEFPRKLTLRRGIELVDRVHVSRNAELLKRPFDRFHHFA